MVKGPGRRQDVQELGTKPACVGESDKLFAVVSSILFFSFQCEEKM